MKYLVDTNILCELVRKKPNDRVLRWFGEIPENLIYVSVLTLGEIRKGIEKLDKGKRKHKLMTWFEFELPAWFQDRILSVDIAVAERWGILQAQIKHPLPAIDSLIAATALQHDLWVVTRNECDFNYPLIQLFNPFKDRNHAKIYS